MGVQHVTGRLRPWAYGIHTHPCPRISGTAPDYAHTHIQIRTLPSSLDSSQMHACSTITSSPCCAYTHIAACMHTRSLLRSPGDPLDPSGISQKQASKQAGNLLQLAYVRVFNIWMYASYSTTHPRYPGPGPPARNTSRMNVPAAFLQGTKSFNSCAARILAQCKAE